MLCGSSKERRIGSVTFPPPSPLICTPYGAIYAGYRCPLADCPVLTYTWGKLQKHVAKHPGVCALVRVERRLYKPVCFPLRSLVYMPDVQEGVQESGSAAKAQADPCFPKACAGLPQGGLSGLLLHNI